MTKNLRKIVRILKANPSTDVVCQYNPSEIYFVAKDVRYELTRIELMTLVLRHIVLSDNNNPEPVKIFRVL